MTAYPDFIAHVWQEPAIAFGYGSIAVCLYLPGNDGLQPSYCQQLFFAVGYWGE